jgi:hypothetical protein
MVKWLYEKRASLASIGFTMLSMGAQGIWPMLWPLWAACFGIGLLTMLASALGYLGSRKAPKTETAPIAPSVSQSPAAGPEATFYRPMLELGEVACHALGKPPVLQITSGHELSLLRHLLAAAGDGRLEIVDAGVPDEMLNFGPSVRRKFDEHSQTTASHLLEFAERHPNPPEFLAFAHKWKTNTQLRHFVLKAEPAKIQVVAANASMHVENPPFERQVSVGEVTPLLHDLAHNRLKILFTGRNASPHTILEGSRSGVVEVVKISTGSPIELGRAGRPSLHHLWRVPHTGRPLPGVPAGSDFQALVELDVSPELAAAIVGEFDAGHHVHLGLAGLDICVFPQGWPENEKRLAFPEFVAGRRANATNHVTALGSSLFTNKNEFFSPTARRVP